MSERSDAEFIRDILEAISRISAYTFDMTYEAFLADTKTQDATFATWRSSAKRLSGFHQTYGRYMRTYAGKAWPEFVTD